jgi:hypothetical protein
MLQNKKKCPTANPTMKPIHHAASAAKTEPTPPTSRTAMSIAEIRKPGWNGGVVITNES